MSDSISILSQAQRQGLQVLQALASGSATAGDAARAQQATTNIEAGIKMLKAQFDAQQRLIDMLL